MTRARDRLEKFLALASEAPKGPWKATKYQVIQLDENGCSKGAVTAYDDGDATLGEAYDFIAASRTEAVWAAEKLREAIELLERTECRWSDCQDPDASLCDRCAFLKSLEERAP